MFPCILYSMKILEGVFGRLQIPNWKLIDHSDEQFAIPPLFHDFTYLKKNPAMKKKQKSINRYLRTLAAAAFAAVPAGSLVADTIDIPAGTTQEYTLTNTTGVIDAHTFTGAGTLILTLTKSDTRVASNFDNFTGTIRFQNAADAPYGVKVNSESSTFSSNANITLDITDGASIYVNSVLENDVYVIGSGSGNQENRGAIRLSNTISGDIYLKGNTTFGLETGRANGTISGSAASGETQTLTLGTAPTALNANFNGVIADGANGGKLAVVVAYGTPTFNAANTFTGGLTVNANAVAKLGDAARVAGNYQINDGGRLEMNFSNSASNFSNMVFTGSGTIRITPTNSNAVVTSGNFDDFTGTIQIASGGGSTKLSLGNGNKLTSNPEITLEVLSGGQIFTSGQVGTIPNAIRIAGTGNGENRGAIRHCSGTISGTITLTADANFGLGGGSVSGKIMGSAAEGQAHTFTLGTANEKGNGTFSGVISDGENGGKLNVTVAYGNPAFTANNTATGALLVSGGTPTFSGSNQFSSITVTGGTLTLSKQNSTIALNAPITVGSESGAAAVLKLDARKAVGDHSAAVTVYDGSRIEINGDDTSIGNSRGITFIGGGDITGTGQFWLRGGGAKLTLTGANAETTISARQLNIFTDTVSIDVQEATGKMLLSSKLYSYFHNNQTGNLNKIGAGELVLSNPQNDFRKDFGVKAGKVTLTNGASFPQANVTVDAGAVLRAENDFAMNTFTLNGTQEFALELLDDGTVSVPQIDVTGASVFGDTAIFRLTTDDTFDLMDLGVLNLVTSAAIEGPEKIQVEVPENLLPEAGVEIFADLVTLDGGFAYQLNLTVPSNGVPEPATWALLVLGTLGVLAVRQRKQSTV